MGGREDTHKGEDEGEERCREEEAKGGGLCARDPCRAVLYPGEGTAPEKGNPCSDN